MDNGGGCARGWRSRGIGKTVLYIQFDCELKIALKYEVYIFKTSSERQNPVMS